MGITEAPQNPEALIIIRDNLMPRLRGLRSWMGHATPNGQSTHPFRRPLHIPRAFHQEEDFLPPQEAGQGRLAPAPRLHSTNFPRPFDGTSTSASTGMPAEAALGARGCRG